MTSQRELAAKRDGRYSIEALPDPLAANSMRGSSKCRRGWMEATTLKSLVRIALKEDPLAMERSERFCEKGVESSVGLV